MLQVCERTAYSAPIKQQALHNVTHVPCSDLKEILKIVI